MSVCLLGFPPKNLCEQALKRDYVKRLVVESSTLTGSQQSTEKRQKKKLDDVYWMEDSYSNSRKTENNGE